MNIEIDPTGATLAAAARLHRDALPNSVISRLGSAYTEAFYRFAAASEKEFVFVAHAPDGSVLGAAVLSLDPSSLTRRLLFGTPLACYLPRKPRLTAEMACDVLLAPCRKRSSSLPHDVPEVIAIFSRTEDRSRGIGRDLLRCVEALLSRQGKHRYFVRTDDRPENRAITFYHREGFQYIGQLRTHGNRFQILLKQFDEIDRPVREPKGDDA
jgi:ribosomal protein S18 acetylase RimI-like enzyme